MTTSRTLTLPEPLLPLFDSAHAIAVNGASPSLSDDPLLHMSTEHNSQQTPEVPRVHHDPGLVLEAKADFPSQRARTDSQHRNRSRPTNTSALANILPGMHAPKVFAPTNSQPYTNPPQSPTDPAISPHNDSKTQTFAHKSPHQSRATQMETATHDLAWN